MNEEQMEAAVVDMLLAHHISEMGAREVSRDFELGADGGLRINITAYKPTAVNHIDVKLEVWPEDHKP
jgi:hypothetical protein